MEKTLTLDSMQDISATASSNQRVVLDRSRQKRALVLCIIITLAVMVLEFVASATTGSLMLFSDGIHMLSHAASLAVSLVAMIFAYRQTGKNYPFGWYRLEIVAALINGISLAGFTAFIIYESVERILNPIDILISNMMVVAAIGLATNLLTALILSRAGLEDLNTKSAFLHMLADTFSSVAIIIGGTVIYYTDWYILDGFLSIVIALVIGKWSYGLIRDTIRILLERTPDHFDLAHIEQHLKTLPQVTQVEALKIWEITSGVYSCNATLQTNAEHLSDYHILREQATQFLHHKQQIQYCHVEMKG